MTRRTHLGRLALVAAALLLGGCVFGGGGDDPEATATAEVTGTPTAVATSAPTVVATPSPTGTAEPAATIEPTREIVGLFSEPRETPPDVVRTVAPRPPSPFEQPDHNDVVLYDTRERTELNLGPGVSKAFSPDGTRLAWTAGLPNGAGEIWVLDLESGERASVGPGWVLWWVDDETLYVRHQERNVNEFVDVESGDRSDTGDPDEVTRSTGTIPEAGGYRLRGESVGGENPFWTLTYVVEDVAGARLPIRFDAYRAVLAPDGALFVATTPEEPSGPDPNAGPHVETGLTNIFEVDLETGVASFVATALVSAHGWPFSATESIVAWTEDACAAPEEPTHRMVIYDRETAALTAITPGAWIADAVGRWVGLDQLGIKAWLDTETLEYVSVLPQDLYFTAWSPDARYAAKSFNFGSDGPCG